MLFAYSAFGIVSRLLEECENFLTFRYALTWPLSDNEMSLPRPFFVWMLTAAPDAMLAIYW